LMSNGTVFAWGINDTGQTNVPTNVTAVSSISGAKSYCLAIETNGGVTAWGAPPALPLGLSNIVAVAAGEYHSMALASNGVITAWGADQSGETVVPPGMTNAYAIAAGWSYSLALSSPVTVAPALQLVNPMWSGSGFSVSFPSQNGSAYALQYSAILPPTSWTTVKSAGGTGGILTLTDTSPTDSQRFYRVQLQ
jgi:hypothetical protein